ncbi:hypothetical protein M514_25744 [Trichuris suis]|uniref:Uncharacterized protein n=1 Tax=Trichuris suis TaxID=68888 RepID=A0A085MXS9_9BILA|nr:hypothetical protein M514_25744 [Trichuris suis]
MIASGDRVVSTYALLDAGSEGSLITERLARQLHLAKDQCQLRLSTFHGQDPPQELFKTTFQIRSVRGEKTFDIKNAIVVPSLNVSNRTIDWSRIKGRLRHLNDLPLVKIDYAQVELLLGADNFDAIQPLETCKPARKGHPYGVKTPLGWTVCGRFSLSKDFALAVGLDSLWPFFVIEGRTYFALGSHQSSHRQGSGR